MKDDVMTSDVMKDDTFILQIDGAADELEDVVKYLELEQQFSTKRTKVCE